MPNVAYQHLNQFCKVIRSTKVGVTKVEKQAFDALVAVSADGERIDQKGDVAEVIGVPSFSSEEATADS